MTTLPSRTYSQRLGEIDGRQLQRASDHFDLGAVEAAEPASAGLWGQNILLTTSAGRFVLRGNPQRPEQLAKERLVAATIHAQSTLGVPWPYQVSDDTEIFGWPFAVMPLLGGTTGGTIWDDADDRGRLALAAAHGRALARLHEARFPGAGPYDDAKRAFVVVDDYRSWTVDRIEVLRSQCRRADALTAEDEAHIEQLLAASAPALDEPLDAVLVHHDFSLANTSYERVGVGAGDQYEACGVFDLGEAHSGDGEEDLVRFLFRRRRDQRAAFVDAYTGQRPLRAGAADRLSLYALADLLFMWEVSRRVGTGWFGDATFVDVAGPIVANARAAAG